MSGSFGLLDWGVVVVLLLATTFIGHLASGKQESLRDFFLGGRRLPWFAVAASIIATEISAVTFISLPSVVARDGGNWTYLQIGLFGSLFARGLIAWFLVPAYYEKEIFSPYDYMGHKLGEGVRRTASGLFALGGILTTARGAASTSGGAGAFSLSRSENSAGSGTFDPGAGFSCAGSETVSERSAVITNVEIGFIFVSLKTVSAMSVITYLPSPFFLPVSFSSEPRISRRSFAAWN